MKEDLEISNIRNDYMNLVFTLHAEQTYSFYSS
jgi:hypothetical protein